jgi:hypothetical protein
MGDNFEMLADVDATAEEAGELSRAVLERFRTLALITGDPSADCVLGGQGYRPGSAVAHLYRRHRREGRFWELGTCGVEPQIGRGFNAWALGPVCKGFICSGCGAEIDPLGDEFEDSVGKAIGEWYDQSGAALLACPRCAHKCSVTEWRCKPPLAFSNLAFRFWNWPHLDSPSWSIDISAVVREVTGHTIVSTHGHI